MDNLAEFLRPIQLANLGIYVILIVSSIVWTFYRQKDYMYGLIMILYGMHGVFFGLYLLVDGLSPQAINAWSAGLKLHANITLLVGIIAMLINLHYDRKAKNGKH